MKTFKDAKAAYEAAVAAKKDAAELATLKQTMDDAFTALSAEDKKTLEGESNIVTLADIRAAIVDAVKTQIEASMPKGATAPTLDDIKAAVEAAFKTHTEAKKVPTTDEIKSIVGAIVTEQVKNIRVPGKQLGNANDPDPNANPEGRISIPTTLRKDNLPLHLKQLFNLMTWGKTNTGVPHKSILNDGIRDSDLQAACQKGERELDRVRGKAMSMTPVEFVAHGRKTLATADNGDFVPVDLSSELQRRLYLESVLAGLLASRELEMPSPDYRLPLTTTLPSFGLFSTENTLAIGSDPGTDGIHLIAKKVMGRCDYSYEIDEDSIIPILPLITSSLAQSAGLALDSMIINGDTTATHMDSDIAANAGLPTNMVAAEKAWKGFRKFALAASLVSDFSTGGISDANLRTLRKKLGKYGLRLNGSTIWLVGPNGYSDMLGIPLVQTLYSYGPQATVLTGELSQFSGMPIIASERCREDLNASGVYDGSTVTKGSVLAVNLDRFLMGRRREFTVEAFRDPRLQQTNIIAAFRRAFSPIETPSATVPTVALGYNYAA